MGSSGVAATSSGDVKIAFTVAGDATVSIESAGRAAHKAVTEEPA
jgi:hypothetical protein